MRLAVIPARGGSKRIQRKNIRLFCGKPIIAWSIEAAIASGCFDQVIVSTDNDEIARVAELWGAAVPFARPPELSDDLTGTSPVIAHAIAWHKERGLSPDPVCCIYATAPFLSASDIRAGCEILEGEDCDFVFSGAGFSSPVQRAFRLSPDGGLKMLQPACFEMRSQDLEATYYDAGQFYWARADAWLRNAVIYGPRSRLLVLPKYRVQDIDDLDDWRRAELMFEAMRRSSGLEAGDNSCAKV